MSLQEQSRKIKCHLIPSRVVVPRAQVVAAGCRHGKRMAFDILRGSHRSPVSTFEKVGPAD